MLIHLKNDYDTLCTRPDRDPQLVTPRGRDVDKYLRRHLRRRGLLQEVGPGRLARFREIAKYKPVTTGEVLAGRLHDVHVAEYRHYVWRVRPHCAYCNAALTRDSLTRDHVIPRSKGGGGGDNLVPACGPCNRAKANHSLLQFLIGRQRRGRDQISTPGRGMSEASASTRSTSPFCPSSSSRTSPTDSRRRAASTMRAC